MMYLSRNWDLSEPSALNKSGLANVANQTVYEGGEEFERQQVRPSQDPYPILSCRIDPCGAGGPPWSPRIQSGDLI